MALPKRKISRRRRDLGRTHYKIAPINLVNCPECGALKKPHVVCLGCGKIKGIEIIKTN